MLRDRELEKRMGLKPEAIRAIELAQAGVTDPKEILRRVVGEFAGQEHLPALEEAMQELEDEGSGGLPEDKSIRELVLELRQLRGALLERIKELEMRFGGADAG